MKFFSGDKLFNELTEQVVWKRKLLIQEQPISNEKEGEEANQVALTLGEVILNQPFEERYSFYIYPHAVWDQDFVELQSLIEFSNIFGLFLGDFRLYD